MWGLKPSLATRNAIEKRAINLKETRPIYGISRFHDLSPLHSRLFPLRVFGMGVLVCNLEAGVEMTPLLAVFLASLLDLKDRTCSIFQLGPGMLLSGSKETKNY